MSSVLGIAAISVSTCRCSRKRHVTRRLSRRITTPSFHLIWRSLRVFDNYPVYAAPGSLSVNARSGVTGNHSHSRAPHHRRAAPHTNGNSAVHQPPRSDCSREASGDAAITLAARRPSALCVVGSYARVRVGFASQPASGVSESTLGADAAAYRPPRIGAHPSP
jgi:hypothetical protein